MNIQTVLNGVTPYNAEHSYATFSKLMEKSYTELSFWGSRNVYVIGYQGSVLLEDVMRKVDHLIESHPHFSEGERVIGKDIEEKISQLYSISIGQKKKSSYITSIFMIIIIWCTPREKRIYNMALEFKGYSFYTKKQYEEIFNVSPREKKIIGYIGDKKLPNSIPIWRNPNDFQGSK